MNIWDASGDLKFMDVRNEFYKETQGVILAPWQISQLRVTSLSMAYSTRE